MLYNGEEVYGVVYMITHRGSGKIYVGQTTDWLSRLKSYSSLPGKKQRKLYEAFVNYGRAAFDIEVIDTAVDKTQLDFLEMLFIAKNQAIEHGFNCKVGGSHGKHSIETRTRISQSKLGHICSAATREKLRVFNTGRKRSPESVEKTRQGHIGRKQPPEAVEKMRQANRGRKRSPEVVERFRQAMTGRKSPGTTGGNSPCARGVVCIPTGKFYPTITEAARELGISPSCIHRSCTGERKFCGKLLDGTRTHWRYATTDETALRWQKPRRTGSKKRGKPDWDSPVHFKVEENDRAYPLCNNGAYSIFWSTNKDNVTCPICLARMVALYDHKKENHG